MSDRMRIPGPDEPEDFSELADTIVYAWAVTMLVCIGLFLFFRGHRPGEGHTEPVDGESGSAAASVKPGAEASADDYDDKEWAEDDIVAAMRRGPRKAAESACASLRPALESGKLDRRVRLELIKVVDRRAEHAPWSCLLRAYLDGDVAPDSDLYDELEEVWADFRRFEVPSKLARRLVADMRQSGDVPEADSFRRWLRLCGLHPSWGGGAQCRQLLAQIAPEEGVDLLMTAEHHLRGVSPDQLDRDLDTMVAGVGYLARHGQHDEWLLTRGVDPVAYDTRLRKAALFLLCRFVNSPDTEVAQQAAMQLADAASVAARATNENLVRRWRATCQLAFREEDDESDSGAAALAVWTGKADDPPDYSLQSAIERGDCPPASSRPAWECGVKLWQAKEPELDLALMSFFTETRYIEWEDE